MPLSGLAKIVLIGGGLYLVSKPGATPQPLSLKGSSLQIKGSPPLSIGTIGTPQKLQEMKTPAQSRADFLGAVVPVKSVPKNASQGEQHPVGSGGYSNAAANTAAANQTNTNPNLPPSYTIYGINDLHQPAMDMGTVLAIASGQLAKGMNDQLWQALRDFYNGSKWASTVNRDQIFAEMATRLNSLGGLSTKNWIPKNQGAFNEGENNYEFPLNPKQGYINHFRQFGPHDFALELGFMYALSNIMALKRGSVSTWRHVSNTLVKTAEGAIKGAQAGGAWGAVVGAAQGLFQGVGEGIGEAVAKHPKELEILSALEKVKGNLEGRGIPVRLPVFSTMGYFSIGNWPHDKGIPDFLSICGQSAPHWGTILQGFYPGAGMAAYFYKAGSTKMSFTLDHQDDVSFQDIPIL